MVTVYVGSLWHSDCDPFVTVVARDSDTARRLLQEWADEEYNNMVSDTPENEPDPEDDTCTGGIFAENLDTLNLSLSQRTELDTDGWTSF